MSRTSTIAKTRAEVWRTRLGSALRTTLAFTIVGCTSLYAPQPLRRYIEFPAFSYLTTILVMSDATLGDTIRCCWNVFCATLQAMILSILTLHIIGPSNFTPCVAVLAVAVSAFVVALPESTHLMTKRIAFGQLVIVYVSSVIFGAEAGVVIHPIHVACSAALGALASVLAMLFPYPRLAYYEGRKFCRLYTANASERLNCNLEAICALDNSIAVDFCSQAKALSMVGAKLLQSIKSNLDGMHWEMPQMRIFNLNHTDPAEKLEDLEIPIRGMDIALSSCTSFPITVIDEELRGVLLSSRGKFSQNSYKKPMFSAPIDATTAPESKKEILNKNISIAYKDLSTSFFLYCLQLLLDDSPISMKFDHVVRKTQKDGGARWSSKKIREVIMNMMPSGQNLTFAIKCSLALGLAVFFGLKYNKDDGYWSGLTISICFVVGREATFFVANARGQGTAMGSVYGLLCLFILQRLADLRFLALLPWVVFSSLLRHSRMYGDAGRISAALGASLILGRKHYGPPTQFAIARITEASIGLVCFIVVEILSSPSRATTLAKSKLSQILRTLQDCISGIAITLPTEVNTTSSSSQALVEGHKKLRSHVHQLEKFIAEAELEPSFWFLPFHGTCYRKKLESLLRIVDILFFVVYSIECVTQLSQKDGAIWVDLQDQVNENIELFKTKVGPTLKCLEEITRMKSLRELEKQLKNKNLPWDIELGKYPDETTFRMLRGKEEVDHITSSFLKHLEEMAEKIDAKKDEDMPKGQMLFHYSCLSFCISSLMKEILEIECEVKELLIWENPSSCPNLNDIYRKISALGSL